MGGLGPFLGRRAGPCWVWYLWCWFARRVRCSLSRGMPQGAEVTSDGTTVACWPRVLGFTKCPAGGVPGRRLCPATCRARVSIDRAFRGPWPLDLAAGGSMPGARRRWKVTRV